MNALYIAWKNLVFRPLSSLLTLLLLAIGAGIIFLIITLSSQLEKSFTSNLANTDMVVGAKGSPLQLILSSLYHIDAPTGNIPMAEVLRLKRNPQVKHLSMLALGDNYAGYRIVGTDDQFANFYELKPASGSLWSEPMEVVLGSEAAIQLQLTLADTFYSIHGLDQENDHRHDQSAFRVVGILKPTGTVVDQLILTSLQSIWKVHESHDHEESASSEGEPHVHSVDGKHDHHDHDHEHEEAKVEEEREVTSALVMFKSSLGNVTIPRMVNEQTGMQAALPAIEINRLLSLLGLGSKLLTALAWLLMLVAGLSLFIALYNSIKERRYEMALLRTFGASPFKVLVLLLNEAIILTLAGCVLGFALSRIAMLILIANLPSQSMYQFQILGPQAEEWGIIAASFVLGLVAALLPALRVYKMDVSRTLSGE
jgi:putative ABC transport system permease protein